MMQIMGTVSGRVQGVFFRRHVQEAAQRRGIRGYARNLPDGRVEVLLCGEESAVRDVQRAVEAGPANARVEDVRWREDGPAAVPQGFEVR